MPNADARPSAAKKTAVAPKNSPRSQPPLDFEIDAAEIHALIAAHLKKYVPLLQGMLSMLFGMQWFANCQWNLRAELLPVLIRNVRQQCHAKTGRDCTVSQARAHLGDLFGVSDRTLLRWEKPEPLPRNDGRRIRIRREALMNETQRQLRRKR